MANADIYVNRQIRQHSQMNQINSQQFDVAQNSPTNARNVVAEQVADRSTSVHHSSHPITLNYTSMYRFVSINISAVP